MKFYLKVKWKDNKGADILMDLLGVRIDNVTMEQAVKKTEEFLAEDKFHFICTPNPEMVMVAQYDEEFRKILNSSELNIPDGYGIVWAADKIGEPLEERVAGYDFIHKIFELGQDMDISFYFLGSKPGVAEAAKEKIEVEYLGIEVDGTNDGYFSVEEEKELIKRINEVAPDVLLVAMGAPKQERFIYKYRDKLKCKIAIGVGGCFDVISGNVKRAPRFFINLHLEWLYRGLTDFRRFKRLFAIPKFMYSVKKIKRKK